MRKFTFPHIRKALVILPVAAALAISGYLVMNRPGPDKKTLDESIRTLRVIETPLVDLVPKTSGYGVAEPGQVWEAVAEVRGGFYPRIPGLKQEK